MWNKIRNINNTAKKNPILQEYCIINSIEEFNKLLLAENKEYRKEIELDDIGDYILTVDNDYFSKHISISEDIKIVLIRIEKIFNDSEKDEFKIDTMIKIISIEKNCYCVYILYEIN